MPTTRRSGASLMGMWTRSLKPQPEGMLTVLCRCAPWSSILWLRNLLWSIWTLVQGGQTNKRWRLVSCSRSLDGLDGSSSRRARRTRPSLTERSNIVRRKLTTLQWAEWHRRRGMKRAQKHASFIMNPFKFTRKICRQRHNGRHSSTQEEVDKCLGASYCDSAKQVK